MEYRVLGPLEVRDGEESLPLAGAKQRALLALLLVHANHVLSRDRLIDELWGGEPPETAVQSLQVYVSRLRKLLPADALLTRPPGYLLEVAPDELDLQRFERLLDAGREALAQGESEEASRLLHDALALWRGPALAEFAFERFAQGEIGRLEDLRLAAVEERIEADLVLGRHADLIGELEALIVENPYRERLRGQLMLALYRSGRQAEALEAYQAARHALVDELGIEPGADLQRLEKAILTQDEALDTPPRPARSAELVTLEPRPEPVTTKAVPAAPVRQPKRWQVAREALRIWCTSPVNAVVAILAVVLGAAVSLWISLVLACVLGWQLGSTIRDVYRWHGLRWLGVRVRSLARIAPDDNLRSCVLDLVNACGQASQIDRSAAAAYQKADRKKLRQHAAHARDRWDLTHADRLAKQIHALERLATERRLLLDESDRIDLVMERLRNGLFHARVSGTHGDLEQTIGECSSRIRKAAESVRQAAEEVRSVERTLDASTARSASA